jgi:hypothetical protein
MGQPSRPDCRGIGIRFPTKTDPVHLHKVQIRSGTHPTPYPMDTSSRAFTGLSLKLTVHTPSNAEAKNTFNSNKSTNKMQQFLKFIT